MKWGIWGPSFMDPRWIRNSQYRLGWAQIHLSLFCQSNPHSQQYPSPAKFQPYFHYSVSIHSCINSNRDSSCFTIYKSHQIRSQTHQKSHIFWLVVYLPLWKIQKYTKISWDDNIPNIWKVIKFMFQTFPTSFFAGGIPWNPREIHQKSGWDLGLRQLPQHLLLPAAPLRAHRREDGTTHLFLGTTRGEMVSHAQWLWLKVSI